MSIPSSHDVFADPRVAELAAAAAAGDAARVRQLAHSGVDVDAHGDAGVTPLLWAIAQRNPAGIAALMAAGADPAGADAQGTTAMQLAATAEDPAMFDALLDGGADPDLRDPRRGRSPIFEAILADREPQFERLLALADLDLADGFGTRPIHAVAGVGDYPKLLRLLASGATPDARDGGGRTFQACLPLGGALRASATPAFEAARAAVIAWLRAQDVAVEGALADDGPPPAATTSS